MKCRQGLACCPSIGITLAPSEKSSRNHFDHRPGFRRDIDSVKMSNSSAEQQGILVVNVPCPVVNCGTRGFSLHVVSLINTGPYIFEILAMFDVAAA